MLLELSFLYICLYIFLYLIIGFYGGVLISCMFVKKHECIKKVDVDFILGLSTLLWPVFWLFILILYIFKILKDHGNKLVLKYIERNNKERNKGND